MTNAAVSSTTHTLLDALTLELYQTEQTAARQCRREADRLGSTQPSFALRALAAHAEAVLRELPDLSRRNGLPTGASEKPAGSTFSGLRYRLLEVLSDGERSYRGTLLACRHGVDVVRMLGHVATRLGSLDLDAFCTSWLNTRVVLLQRVEDELVWFADHPVEATKIARPLVASLRQRLQASF